MGSQQIPAYLFGHFSDEVSKETLSEFLNLMTDSRKVVILGFSDYTKHIINLFGDNVLGIFELDPRFVGFEFRGVTVRHLSELSEISYDFDDFVVCVLDNLIDYTQAVQAHKLSHKTILWPENFDGKLGHKYDIKSQSPLYRYNNTPDRLGEPATMMPRDTMTFLTELARASLRASGDVAEVGVWQGGSAWNIAKMMNLLQDDRHLHLFDFFDDHSRTNAEAIMCLDEIRARFAFYSKISYYRGMADQHMEKISDKKFCFVHIDLGFIPEVLDFFWTRLNEGGVMALDNYGHIRSWPTEFDRFFKERGYSVIRVPFSYQAFVVK